MLYSIALNDNRLLIFDIDALFDGHKINLVRDSENSGDSKERYDLKHLWYLMTSYFATLTLWLWQPRELGVPATV